MKFKKINLKKGLNKEICPIKKPQKIFINRKKIKNQNKILFNH